MQCLGHFICSPFDHNWIYLQASGRAHLPIDSSSLLRCHFSGVGECNRKVFLERDAQIGIFSATAAIVSHQNVYVARTPIAICFACHTHKQNYFVCKMCLSAEWAFGTVFSARFLRLYWSAIVLSWSRSYIVACVDSKCFIRKLYSLGEIKKEKDCFFGEDWVNTMKRLQILRRMDHICLLKSSAELNVQIILVVFTV